MTCCWQESGVLFTVLLLRVLHPGIRLVTDVQVFRKLVTAPTRVRLIDTVEIRALKVAMSSKI